MVGATFSSIYAFIREGQVCAAISTERDSESEFSLLGRDTCVQCIRYDYPGGSRATPTPLL